MNDQGFAATVWFYDETNPSIPLTDAWMNCAALFFGASDLESVDFRYFSDGAWGLLWFQKVLSWSVVLVHVHLLWDCDDCVGLLGHKEIGSTATGGPVRWRHGEPWLLLAKG